MTAQWAGRLPVPGKTPTRTTADRQNLEGLDVGELTDAGTQVSDATLARPDLAVYDRERKERVLMEAKFWAGLTENQPNAYLARLPLDQRPAVLLFVAPEARLETLWPELRRLIEPPFDWQPVETSHDTEIKCALVDGATRYLVLASWRALLNRMLSFAMSSGDSIEADIRETPLWISLPLLGRRHYCSMSYATGSATTSGRHARLEPACLDDAVELAREREIVNTITRQIAAEARS